MKSINCLKFYCMLLISILYIVAISFVSSANSRTIKVWLPANGQKDLIDSLNGTTSFDDTSYMKNAKILTQDDIKNGEIPDIVVSQQIGENAVSCIIAAKRDYPNSLYIAGAGGWGQDGVNNIKKKTLDGFATMDATPSWKEKFLSRNGWIPTRDMTVNNIIVGGSYQGRIGTYSKTGPDVDVYAEMCSDVEVHGTCNSAVLVATVCANYWSEHPELSRADIKTWLVSQADPNTKILKTELDGIQLSYRK